MLDVIYRDDHLIAVHKPAGLLVHRSNLDRHESRFAVQIVRDQVGRHVYPVHRLDKGTSGILVFAVDPEATAAVGRQFENNQVAKRYVAVVRGWPAESGRVDHPLTRRFDDYGRKYAPDAQPPALPAQTAFRRLATVELPVAVDRYPHTRYALVELVPRTGRQHQLRRHMKHLAHPIIGDATWGKGVHNRYFADTYGCSRLLLACVGLELAHPATGAPLKLAAPPAHDFLAPCRALGWQAADFETPGDV